MAPVSYLLAFCRVTLGLVFLFSGSGKVLHFPAFVQTIGRFRILPTSLSAPAAVLFCASEWAIIVCLVAGGPWLLVGFGLAGLLLLLFCAAMMAVIFRQIHTSCACFGATEEEITWANIWRNAGLLLCVLGGCTALSQTEKPLSLAGWAVISLSALGFVTIWLRLRDIVNLFHQG